LAFPDGIRFNEVRVVDAATSIADKGLLSLVLDFTGALVSCNEELDLADQASAQQLIDQAHVLVADRGHRSVRLQLAAPGGRIVRIAALMNTLQVDVDSLVISLLGFDDTDNAIHLSKLEYATEMLNGFTDASTEAMWCIEYTEPVDLTLGEQEIVRQVFENECHWSMCNRAMAEIYNLPPGLDFNSQRVSLYFRRNPINEAFVRQLIDSRFHIDSAASVDVRHDGTVAYVENSVRCHIEGGKMVRMWGTVRDTTEFRVAHNRLAQREREVREVLSAIPDAIVVVNKAQQVLAINPAFESLFGWRADSVLGKSVSTIIDLDSNTEDHHRWFARAEHRWIADVNKVDGTSVSCDVRMAPFPDDELSRYVLCIRSARPANDIVKTPSKLRRRSAKQAALPR
jgi:PAS domain S-box-containing protein